MRKIMDSKIKILIGVLVIGIILIGGWWIWKETPLFVTECNILENDIKQDLEEANYCEKDDDCVVVSFGCPFGCWNFVNKNIDLSPIKEKVEEYKNQCSGCLYKCGAPPENLICQNEKCTMRAIKQVTITADKTEYSQGENISANANFTGKIYVFSDGAWSIYRLNGNSWIKIAESIGCSSFPDCEKINFDKIEDCQFPICEAPAWYEIEESHPYARWIWNQKYPTGERKTYKCEKGEKTIDHECIVHSQVTPGKYKVRFEYALSAEEFGLERKGVDTQYTEQEFTIK